MNAYSWYSTLIKPLWAPPSWLFGPVWTFLYAIIFVTFGTVFYKIYKGELPLFVATPFILNIIFNFAFIPLQFGLKNNLLATIDIILVLGTLIWLISRKLQSVSGADLNWIRYANIPYLLWVSFATVLQLTITYLNWK